MEKEDKLFFRDPRQYLITELSHLAEKGMYFPGVSKKNIIPTEKCVENTRNIIDSCGDEDLYRWDVTMAPNGSLYLYYVEERYYLEGREICEKPKDVSAMINVAEAGVSGFLETHEEYITVIEKIDELKKIFDIFKRVRLHTDPQPSTQTLLKIFWMFDKHGLIKDDLCFDPEHFMETVIKEHWDDWDDDKKD